MGVTVCLPLFGNPGHELEEGAKATSQELRTLADALRDRLVQCGRHARQADRGRLDRPGGDVRP